MRTANNREFVYRYVKLTLLRDIIVFFHQQVPFRCLPCTIELLFNLAGTIDEQALRSSIPSAVMVGMVDSIIIAV